MRTVPNTKIVAEIGRENNIAVLAQKRSPRVSSGIMVAEMVQLLAASGPGNQLRNR